MELLTASFFLSRPLIKAEHHKEITFYVMDVLLDFSCFVVVHLRCAPCCLRRELKYKIRDLNEINRCQVGS